MGWTEDIEAKRARIAAIRQKRNASNSGTVAKDETVSVLTRAKSPLSPSASPSPVEEILGNRQISSRSASRSASLAENFSHSLTSPSALSSRDELISSIIAETSSRPNSRNSQPTSSPPPCRTPSLRSTSASASASGRLLGEFSPHLDAPSSTFMVTPVLSLENETKEPLMYSKQIQTELAELPKVEEPEIIEEQVTTLSLADELDQDEDEQELESTEPKLTIKDMTHENNCKYATNDPKLSRFLFHTFNMLNRASSTQAHPTITVDYGDTSSSAANMLGQISQIARFKITDSSTDLTGRRSVTSIDWSPRHPELIAVAYSKPLDAIRETKGLVIVWNLYNSNNRPEYVFHAPSEVLCVKFARTCSHFLFGSAYNGQVLMWDMNLYASSVYTGKDPVSGSKFIGQSGNSGGTFMGHSTPLYAMEFAGNYNASQLYTASSDGKVCCWMPEQLSKPQDILELHSPRKLGGFGAPGSSVVPSCMAVSRADASLFFVGTESGNVYQCNRTGDATRNAGIDSRGFYRGHTALVTSIGLCESLASSSVSGSDLGHILLTTSLDWTIKLWSVRKFSDLSLDRSNTEDSGSDASGFHASLEAFLDIQCDYPVYDAAWSPTNPGQFASVDGSGELSIWSIFGKTESPVASALPKDGPSTAVSHSGNQPPQPDERAIFSPPLTKLQWDTDGKRIVVGSSSGDVTVFALDKDIYLPSNSIHEGSKSLKRLIDDSNKDFD